MLDRDFLADGNLPLPNGSTVSPQDFPNFAAVQTLAAIREKAERIVSLLCRTSGRDVADENRLSLAEELAQDIIELCPVCGGPDCVH